MIDLWNREHINPLIENKIIPLLQLARKMGITIIHSPSNKYNEIHSEIAISPEDILITGYDDLGDELELRGIKTLLYAGQDLLKCVLDKPVGIINNHIKNKSKYQYILIEDGVISDFYETYSLGINIFEKAFGLCTNVSEIFEAFNTEPPNIIKKDIALPRFSTSTHKLHHWGGSHSLHNIYSDEIALVLIGPSVGTHKEYKLDNVINWSRQMNIPVVQTPISKAYKEYKDLDLVKSEKEFIKFVKVNNIQNLFYLGSSMDEEMIWGNTGLIRVYIQDKFNYNRMPNCYIIKDYSWVSSKSLILSSNVVKSTLLRGYAGSKAISFDELKELIKPTRNKSNFLLMNKQHLHQNAYSSEENYTKDNT